MANRPPVFRPAFAKPKAQVDRQRRAAHDKTRPSAAARLYDAKWRKARAEFIKLNPICCVPGCAKPTSHVDHRKPHRGDLALFWERSNWQPMCGPHHSAKTARHDGGLGNRRRPSPTITTT